MRQPFNTAVTSKEIKTLVQVTFELQQKERKQPQASALFLLLK